ncbi:coenzyme F420-0:L-glutamate ligase [Candidatus Peregrinibacteria bacterium]|nr:coenzyme F420-0:L-glutamate ligase [Candidatus Peregrinibacteria bacterium]
MEILKIQTGHIKSGDNLVNAILNNCDLKSGDILAISSKVIATAQGAAINLSSIEISDTAREYAKKYDRDPAYFQAILNETERLNGNIINDDKRAILTELKPDGLNEGTLMAASAGLDQSNIEDGYAVGWPIDPVSSASEIFAELKEYTPGGILITDSCLRPRRLGVTAQALVVIGFDPIISQVDSPDLFGKPLNVTHEAVADQLATAANFVMGNADQAIPAVIIRDHSLARSEFKGWVPGIDRSEDLFKY